MIQRNTSGFSRYRFRKDYNMFSKFTYHRDLTVLHIGCEPPSAYFIPYQNQETAHSGDRCASQRFLSLCGEWDFHYYRSSAELEDFTASGWDPSGARKMTVPMSWQMALHQGYDAPQYVNVSYPFPVDPPNLPDDNPCGLYERDFYLTRELLDTCCGDRKPYFDFRT